VAKHFSCTKDCDGFYSRSLGRCTLGKINPRTIKGGVEAVGFMGNNYICALNVLRNKIIEKANLKYNRGVKIEEKNDVKENFK